MSLVEKLRTITESLGWVFHYGRRDFQNLVEADTATDAKNYFFLDPVTRRPAYSDTGTFTGFTDFSGYFMILTKSDLDEVYDGQLDADTADGKWLKYIKPKLDVLLGAFNSAVYCENSLQIKTLDITDMINVFDENLDGILVNYTISQYE